MVVLGLRREVLRDGVHVNVIIPGKFGSVGLS